MKKLKKSRFMAVMVSCLLLINTIMPTLLVKAAATDMDTSFKSTVNPPQSITGKTEIASWSYSSTPTVYDIPATSGYYTTTSTGNKSILNLYRNNLKFTGSFSWSTSTISNSGYNGQTDKGYWLISTSTKGFKDLIFNFNTRSSGTGPRDFNTEWSADGNNWAVFGNTSPTSPTTVKIETTSPAEQFGMALPVGAENLDTLYIRVLQKSETSEGNGTVASGGTHGVNSLQLWGAKNQAYTTPAVTVAPTTANPILDATPITLSCSDTNAQIFYTTDGSNPAATVGGSTKLYSGPFTALSEGGFNGTNPFVVKAVAKSGTLLTSDTATASFNQQIITSNEDAKKLSAGAYAWVKGIGTYLNGNTTLYIQDGMKIGSGLCIYKSGANFSSYVGKEIYVYGKASLYNGLMEIVPDDVSANVVVRNAAPTIPTPIKVMFDQLLTRDYEGMLVSCDTIKLDNVAGTNTGSYYNHSVSQANIPLTMRAKGINSSVGTTGSYVNIVNALVNYNSASPYNGIYLFSTNTSELVATATPTVEFMKASVPTGTAVPLNSMVTLATSTTGANITYSLNGGTSVTTSGNSVDVTIDSFKDGKAIITAYATDGTYTTATQTFTYTQSQVIDVTANPVSGPVVPGSPITLTSKSTGATIQYSLYKNSYSDTDGTLVGTANQTYTTPITVDAASFPVRIVAKAILTNYLDSNVVIFTYTAKKAVGGEKNYYGSIHAHTAENSDGQGTLAEADAYARDIGKYDYFILTDHSNSYDKAPATDSVAKIGNINNYNTDNQQWLNGKKAAADATTSTFLCDYGYEMTWSGGPGHINTFNTSGFVSRNNTALNNKTNDAGMQAYYQLLKNTPGSISQFNHPGPTFGNFSNFAYYDPQIDDKVNLIEVGNGEGAVGSGGYFQSIDQYILALDKGWHLAPTNNGDNHKKGWGTSNTCATVVYTNDFTMAGIYQAMRDRSVWATENRDLDVTYHLSDGTNTFSMGAILNAPPPAINITVTAKNKAPEKATSNIASIELISGGGKVVDKKTYSAGSSDVTYTYSKNAPAAGYYFAKITDNQGFVAVTAPIWLGSAPKVGITSVVNSAVMPVTTEPLSLTTTFFNNESTAATLKSISYTVDGDTSANKTYTPVTSIATLGSATHVFSYTPTTAGTKTVNISAVITVNGVDTTYTATSTMKVADIDKVLYVGLDASHGNEYVSGGSYPDSMANMMTLAANNSLRVVQLKTSQDFIAACSNPKYKMIILNAPSRKSVAAWLTPTDYTPDEIAALKIFSENGNTLVFGTVADYGESNNADPASPKKHMSELQNDVLSAIGSTLREGDDEVMDDATNGGQAYRLYPTEFNKSNPLLLGVVSEQTYSQYSGSTIYAVDKTTGERTSTLPESVSPMVYGFPTTYSAECDNDNFGYGSTKPTFPYVNVGTYKTDKGLNNDDGLYIPKYVNPNSKVANNPEEKLLAASEKVVHPNGKTSLVVVAGGSFMSNFEIQVALDNAFTLPYANYNIMDNLYKTINPVKITSIADAKNLPDGTEVVIEGIATSGVNTQDENADTNKGFFDCIYAQDSTGGINLFPVAYGVEEGQKARFYGTITHYQGEVELTVSKVTILNEDINKIEPTVLTSKASMQPENTGLLVKTKGIVSNIYKNPDGTINQFTINDGSGPAIVFINGYITKGTTLPFIKDGATVSVVGLASIGEVVSDSDMHPRIRVRDRAEIVNIDVVPPVITVAGVVNNGIYNTAVTPLVSTDKGIFTMTLNGDKYTGEPITKEGNYTLVINAVNRDGYTSETTLRFLIDLTAPKFTIKGINDGEAVKLNQDVIITWEFSDEGSGLQTVSGDIISGDRLDTSKVGKNTLTFSAVDKAGNKTVKTITYYVNYDYSGVLNPINVDGFNVFKAGSTVPVKFQLKDANGSYVNNVIAKLYLATIKDGKIGTEFNAVSTSAASDENVFRIDGNQYIFNLSTKNLVEGSYQLRIELGDGSINTINITLR
ncbi:PxKF domain-containing protein [Candidatus Clostridium radicumherbarum]|uniref:PxKF domain-containing protein n=1 Tax=Candidatus Clostridium radicumherbarum TaxID=3381662 RepID=A0ABW8TU51_9CLOT